MAEHHKVAKDGVDWFVRKQKGIEVGDVFSVPLPDGGFGFGRLLNAKAGATVAEFFRIRRDSPDFDPAILEAGRLFAPTAVLVEDIAYRNRKRDWKVIHKDPEFYPQDLYAWKFARSPDGRDNWVYYTLFDVWTDLGSVSVEDVANRRVGSIMPQITERMANIISQQLAKQGL